MTDAPDAGAPEPRVAIITPTFNDGRLLAESVASALAQTHRALEVIVIDDGSTDPQSLATIDEVAALDRVTRIRQPNAGPSAARNAGIRASDAEFFFALDADDRIEPPLVAEAVAAMRADPALGIVYAQGRNFGEIDAPLNFVPFSWETELLHNTIPGWSLFRRADWEAVGGYDEGMIHGLEDHDFILRILALDRTTRILDGEYFWYRRHGLTRNTNIALDREKWVASHARMLRNSPELHAEHAEHLFRDYILRHDELRDMKRRYAAFERIRLEHPRVFQLAGDARRGLERFGAVVRRARRRGGS